MHDVGVPRAQHRAYAPRGGEVPVATHADRGRGNARRAQPADERRLGRGDHEWLVTLLTLAAREEVHLPLAAAPFPAGVKVEHAKRLGGGHPEKNGVRVRVTATRPRLASQQTAPN